MNAIVPTLLALISPGGHIMSTIECYSEVRAFIRDRMRKMGIRSTFIDIDEDMESSLKDVLDQNNDVTLFYADSLTNPMLNVGVMKSEPRDTEQKKGKKGDTLEDGPQGDPPTLKCLDIRRIVQLHHQKGVLVCIDSTLASPINQKPLTLGVDLVLHSATKYMAGHHDVIVGCNAAYMIIRGLKMMALRVEASNRTALLMAHLLEAHPKIDRVHYPGLESSPWHHLAKTHRAGYGGVVSFEVKADLHGTMRFIDALEIPFIATSLGGCESLVQQPAVMSFWGHTDEDKANNGISNNFVRFSFGIEKFEDLRDDILQALDRI
ncbi:hypothetical protein PR202_gb07925 [Eleusine coracana subsp. coracana]|uniref:Cystathionine beta-lyase n=1 Tax=Eleusine coracana subsp. coracana TaxID=191504 RepID=A0AAV5EAZ0_ELECO|nr:hypothetical protein PR202_gb07925 [Eleusine coracana subsp. coracana]